MKTKEKLEILRNYYYSTRGKGHTTLMRKGTDNVKDKLVLCYNYQSGEDLRFKNNELISWHGLKKLYGHNKPLAIDNGTMTVILESAIEEIERLEEENIKLRKENG